MSNKKESISRMVKEARIAKGYTQQEISDLTGISLRSVQRIESAEVLPRMYTLKILAQHLNFSIEVVANKDVSTTSPNAATTRYLNKTQKIIITISTALILALLLGAFLAQSHGFPETTFELFLLTAGIIFFYAIILYRIWR